MDQRVPGDRPAPAPPSAASPGSAPPSAASAASAAADVLRRRSGIDRHGVAVVLGSGWSAAAARLGPPHWQAPVTDLPGFPAPTALGHRGTVISLRRGGRRVLVFLGRVHLYEGHRPGTVAHAVRTAVAAGCGVIVLTNAAGVIRPGIPVGTPVLLRDHLNLTARSPLGGIPFLPTNPPTANPPTASALPARPVGVEVYSARLRDLARAVDPDLPDGVYAGLPGPHFETPADIWMLRAAGADLVGMSTVLEATAARAAGAEVLGVSLATNLAAGVSPVPLSGDDVIAAGLAAVPRLGALLGGVLDQLG